MSKFLIVLLSISLSMISSPIYADSTQRNPLPAQNCSQWTKYVKNITDHIICRAGYVSLYNPNAMIPDVVIYEDNQKKLSGCVIRSDSFAPDNSISNSPLPSDYSGSKYDRGHMSNDLDNRYDVLTERESFIMTNMAPQLKNYNRGIFKSLEQYVREVAYQNNELIIITGAIYKPNNPRINGKEIIPTAFYKILIDPIHNTTQSFIIPQNYISKDLSTYIVHVSDITKASGVNFNLNMKENMTFMSDIPNIPDHCK